jgi:hypothetical protein
VGGWRRRGGCPLWRRLMQWLAAARCNGWRGLTRCDRVRAGWRGLTVGKSMGAGMRAAAVLVRALHGGWAFHAMEEMTNVLIERKIATNNPIRSGSPRTVFTRHIWRHACAIAAHTAVPASRCGAARQASTFRSTLQRQAPATAAARPASAMRGQ